MRVSSVTITFFLSDYKYRFKNPQSGEWTFLTIKTYADEYEKMFTNGDPAKLELTEKRRVLSKFLHHICVQLPTPFPWVDPDIPEFFDDFIYGRCLVPRNDMSSLPIRLFIRIF